MDENNIVELLWMNGQIVRRETQKTTSDRPSPSPPVFRSGVGGEGNPLLLHDQPSHENIFIQEDEMAYWLHHPHFYSDVLYSEVVSSQPQSYISHATPGPPAIQEDQPPLDRKAENFMSFSRLRDNLLSSGGVESVGPSMAMVKESTLVVSNATPSSSVIDQSYITPPATHVATTTGVVSQTLVVPAGNVGKGKAVATTEPVLELAGPLPKKPKEDHGSKTSRKRSRAAAMHNLSERRRREKINKNMKDLQELIPRCNKTDKASMLEEAIQYIKSLEMQIQMMMSMGGGGMMSMMYREDMHRFMPHIAMGINREPPFTPFPRPAHVGPPYPWPPSYPFPNFDQAFDPASNQPGFPGYLNPYSQFVGPQQMQPSPPMQNQTTLQMSLSQASSSSKEPEGQVNKPTSY